jgi:hypothetical protein
MIRVALFAVFAIGLLAAPGAHAQKFQVEAFPVTLAAEAPGTFENASNETKIKCGKVQYTATMVAAAAEQIRVGAAFWECWNGGSHVEVLMNGCTLLWTAPAEAGKAGAFQISCEGSKKVELIASTCTAKATSQTTGGGATYANFGEKSSRDFVSSIAASAIQYEFSGFNCNSIFGSGKDGWFTSSPTVTTLNKIGTWVS